MKPLRPDKAKARRLKFHYGEPIIKGDTVILPARHEGVTYYFGIPASHFEAAKRAAATLGLSIGDFVTSPSRAKRRFKPKELRKYTNADLKKSTLRLSVTEERQAEFQGFKTVEAYIKANILRLLKDNEHNAILDPGSGKALYWHSFTGSFLGIKPDPGIEAPRGVGFYDPEKGRFDPDQEKRT